MNEAVGNIIDVAKELAKQDAQTMRDAEIWDEFIVRIFRDKTGLSYDSALRSRYSKDHQKFIDQKSSYSIDALTKYNKFLAFAYHNREILLDSLRESLVRYEAVAQKSKKTKNRIAQYKELIEIGTI